MTRKKKVTIAFAVIFAILLLALGIYLAIYFVGKNNRQDEDKEKNFSLQIYVDDQCETYNFSSKDEQSKYLEDYLPKNIKEENSCGWFSNSEFTQPIIELPNILRSDLSIYTKKATLDCLNLEFNEEKHCYSVSQVIYQNKRDIVIPLSCSGSIEGLGAVCLIEDNAFLGANQTYSITMPYTIMEIGSHVFANCYNLQSNNMPDSYIYSLRSIGVGVFSGCDSLKNIKLSNNLSSLGEGAFRNSALENLIIPSSVKDIGNACFSNCINLKEVVIPSTVRDIGHSAFAFSGLKKVDVGAFIIEEEASSYCKSLDELIVRKSVREIGKQVVKGCPLQIFTIEDGVKVLGSNVFSGANITKLELPESIEEIDGFAFLNCKNLKEISIASGVMESKVFSGCVELEKIYFGAKVQNISMQIFEGCPNINDIKVSSKSQKYTIQDKFCEECNVVIDKTTQTLVLGSTNGIIPNDGSVIRIGVSAFENLNIDSINLPNKLVEI